MSEALEGLRERIRQIERAGAADAPPGAPRSDRVLPVEPRALGSLEEALAVPCAGFEPREVFGIAMDRLARLLEADRSMLFLLDPERGHLVPAAARGFRRDDLGGVSIAAGEGLVGRTFLEGRPLAYSRPPEITPTDSFIARFPVRDAVAVPIRAEGQVIGVLYAGRRGREAPFSTDESRLLLVIADRVGTAFAHLRLVERTTAQVARLREIGAFGGHALVGRDLTEVLARACEAACRLLGVQVAALAIAQGAGGLRLAASSGIPATTAAEWRGDPAEGLVREVFSAERAVAVADLRERGPAVEGFLRETESRGCLAVPLRIHERAVGALYFADPRPREFSGDEAEAAQLLASLAAHAIENDRLYGEARGALEALRETQERLVQVERVRALGEMASGLAHEFSDILAVILGKTQLMLGRISDEATREGLGHVEEAAWRAADIVRRLQAFAGTQMDDAISVVEMNTLVQDAVTLTRGMWKDEADSRGVSFEVVTELGEAPPVRGNAGELREAVTNLVLNALDAMPAGGRLALRTRPAEGGVELTVSDAGEGMSDEVRRRIFDPFFSTRAPLRTGLGLSVVHGTVARHHGRIDVWSEEGRGTTVSIWLPGAPAPSAPAVREEGPEPAPAEAASILVLEDEEQIRTMLVETLTRAGHTVDSAPDGLTGLARFQRGSFDVVLTDLSLPERSGLEVARSVKRMRPETPVVLITGWGHLLDPARLRESGVDLTLVKPFRLERVMSILSQALRLRRSA